MEFHEVLAVVLVIAVIWQLVIPAVIRLLNRFLNT